MKPEAFIQVSTDQPTADITLELLQEVRDNQYFEMYFAGYRSEKEGQRAQLVYALINLAIQLHTAPLT